MKHRSFRHLALLAAVICLGLLVLAGVRLIGVFDAAKGQADASDPVQVKRGQLVYAEYCASCHGGKLEGQPNWQSRLPNGRLPAPPHDESGHTWHHPDAQLFEVTKYGLKNIAPPDYQTDMQAYEGVLTDGQIWDVLAYIKSTWPKDIQARQEKLNRGPSH
ncbi:MAG: c-type cytochrome [Alphaproteobacteria bacterium]|nr:c-type cytochrome [Alphaproteobacteria bacterium]